MTDLRRAEEAVIQAAMKWADTQSVTKPSRAEEHNLWVRVGELTALRASQEAKPCGECGGIGVAENSGDDPDYIPCPSCSAP